MRAGSVANARCRFGENVLLQAARGAPLSDGGVNSGYVIARQSGTSIVFTEYDYPRWLMGLWQMFLLTPAQGAECSLYVATAPELAAVSGEYFEKSRAKPASREARDESTQDRLWALTAELIGRAKAPLEARLAAGT
jgi:hypothetical protein